MQTSRRSYLTLREFRSAYVVSRQLGSSDRPRVDFSNAKDAFKTKSTGDLVKSYLIYTMFKYDWFVDNSAKIMGFAQRMLGPSLFNKLMKSTFYSQFAAGETQDDIVKAFAQFRSVGVRSVLNYSAEEDSGSVSTNTAETIGQNSHSMSFYDTNTSVLLDSIKLTKDSSVEDDGMIAIKLTGICPTLLLSKFSSCVKGGEKVFELLADRPSLTQGQITRDTFTSGLNKIGITPAQSEDMWAELNSSDQRELNIMDWKSRFLPKTTPYKAISATNNCSEFLPSLSENELAELDKTFARVDSLGQCASDSNVKLLIDAEQTYYQSAIQYFAINYLMTKYNHSKALVYNTHQCYLKKTEGSLRFGLHMADTRGFHYGVKLVRGAYMEQEKSLAAENGYESPVWDTKDQTNSNYFKLLEMMLHRIKNTEQDSIVVASHNEDTIHFTMDKLHEFGLSQTDGRVVFGQVMGMADHLALSIASAGYMAYKFMPFGPVEEVLPYLARRANENRGMLDGPVRERRILAGEIKRRLTEQQ